MNSQEREIIAGIFKRLEQAADQPRDPEADRFIADKLRQQPYAPYAMAQSIYVQEEAMKSLNQQIEELRHEVEHLRNQAPQSGGFLSSIFGGGGGRQQAPTFGRPGPQAGAGPQQGGPWGQQGGAQQGGPWAQQGGYPQQGGFAAPHRQGSGFLGTALTTAAGVAGGMVVGNALMNAFSGSHAGFPGKLARQARARPHKPRRSLWEHAARKLVPLPSCTPSSSATSQFTIRENVNEQHCIASRRSVAQLSRRGGSAA